jgi:hypothetical protein
MSNTKFLSPCPRCKKKSIAYAQNELADAGEPSHFAYCIRCGFSSCLAHTKEAARTAWNVENAVMDEGNDTKGRFEVVLDVSFGEEEIETLIAAGLATRERLERGIFGTLKPKGDEVAA